MHNAENNSYYILEDLLPSTMKEHKYSNIIIYNSAPWYYD